MFPSLGEPIIKKILAESNSVESAIDKLLSTSDSRSNTSHGSEKTLSQEESDALFAQVIMLRPTSNTKKKKKHSN